MGLALAAAVLAAALPTVSRADAGTTASPGVILVLGDSISAAYGIQREEGWVALLGERLAAEQRPWTVVNASISGETTGGGLARLQATLDQHDPDIVIVELGGNDGLRGYPVKRIRENLTAMLDSVAARTDKALVMEMRIPPNYGARYTRAFQSVFARVAEESGATLVPFFLEDVALAPGMMQRDGIHPTSAAQPLLLDAVWPYLEPLID